MSSWSGSYALLPAVQLCPEKKEHQVGSRAAAELLTLSKLSPGALDLPSYAGVFLTASPALLSSASAFTQIKPFVKLTFQEKTTFLPFCPLPKDQCRITEQV